MTTRAAVAAWVCKGGLFVLLKRGSAEGRGGRGGGCGCGMAFGAVGGSESRVEGRAPGALPTWSIFSAAMRSRTELNWISSVILAFSEAMGAALE